MNSRSDDTCHYDMCHPPCLVFCELKTINKKRKKFKKVLDKGEIICYNIIRADMAQSVEHILGKDEVPGSNPGIS